MNAPSDLLAVLVDADNVSPSRIGAVLAEVARFGTASVKRVYGDWTTAQLGSWKTAASEHVIQPMQQFAHTKGKNSTDSALIIDAMDLLYTGRFQGFCIVSSDSDFTRLASRIREEGITPSTGSESERRPHRSAMPATASRTSTFSESPPARPPPRCPRSSARRCRCRKMTSVSSTDCGAA